MTIPKPTKSDILKKAELAVTGDRQLDYGSPEENFRRIRELWNAHILNRFGDYAVCLTEEDVALMMILMKVGRLANTSDHLDSWVDIAGYAACGGEISANLDDE